MWLPGIFPSNLFRLFFLQPWIVFSHVYTGQYSAEDSRETLQIFRELVRVLSLSLSLPLSLWTAVSFPLVCLTNFSSLGLSRLLAPFPHLLKTARLPGLLLPLHCLKMLSRQWLGIIAGLTLSARSPSLITPLHCWQLMSENHCFVPLTWNFNFVLDRSVNLVFVAPPWLKEEVTWLILFWGLEQAWNEMNVIQWN